MNEIKEKIDNAFASRDEFFALLDSLVPKKNGTDVFDFEAAKPVNLKQVYEKFYAYDYNMRKLMPYLYKAYDIK
ncbi:hypothetical protein LMG7974_00227 [Campylobacter majalis]|uniref:Chain-length determining protein n=1 Tax=Campylobacter majalis TaxID=2790656 RepID=A0ABM8Q365_9BACT|nr:CmeU family protein [Campylobacter majalis]CAD7287300.1 hypothetical protein LMG7974_00227 [Campylobacter majalis]